MWFVICHNNLLDNFIKTVAIILNHYMKLDDMQDILPFYRDVGIKDVATATAAPKFAGSSPVLGKYLCEQRIIVLMSIVTIMIVNCVYKVLLFDIGEIAYIYKQMRLQKKKRYH